MSTFVRGSVDPAAVAEALTAWASHSASESASLETVSTGITPEIVAVIEAAATAFVGTSIRILSVRILSELESESEQDSGSWAGRGRDIVHASHNLVQRGH